MNTKPTAEVVLAALSANPESTTTAEVALVAGLGRSTVGKALAALESDGRVARTPGGCDGRRRVPDRWAAVGPDTKLRPSTKASGQRLAKGELRALVLAHLQAHAGEELSPTAVAGALGRSAGAVGNAMAALVEVGSVSEVSAVPRRFAYPA